MIDTPSGNQKQGQDAFLIHATNLSHNYALPHFMTQHSCEDLKCTDTPSIFSAFIQAPRDPISNPICAHNPMATQYNQTQYLTLLKQICAHNSYASQVSQANLSNSLSSQCLPGPGMHVLKNMLQK